MNAATSSPTGVNGNEEQVGTQVETGAAPQEATESPHPSHKNAGAKFTFKRNPTLYHLLEGLGPREAAIRMESVIFDELKAQRDSVVFAEDDGYLRVWVELLEQVYTPCDDYLTPVIASVRVLINRLIQDGNFYAKTFLPPFMRKCLDLIRKYLSTHEGIEPRTKSIIARNAIITLLDPFGGNLKNHPNYLDYHMTACRCFGEYVIHQQSKNIIGHTRILISPLSSVIRAHLQHLRLNGLDEKRLREMTASYKRLLLEICHALLNDQSDIEGLMKVVDTFDKKK